MSNVEQIALEVRSSLGILGEAPTQETVHTLSETRMPLYIVHSAIGKLATTLVTVADFTGKQLMTSTVTHRRAFDGAASLHETLRETENTDAMQMLVFADAMLAEAGDQVSAAGELVAKISQLRQLVGMTEALSHEVMAAYADIESHAGAVLGAQQGAIEHGQRYLEQLNPGQAGNA